MTQLLDEVFGYLFDLKDEISVFPWTAGVMVGLYFTLICSLWFAVGYLLYKGIKCLT